MQIPDSMNVEMHDADDTNEDACLRQKEDEDAKMDDENAKMDDENDSSSSSSSSSSPAYLKKFAEGEEFIDDDDDDDDDGGGVNAQALFRSRAEDDKAKQEVEALMKAQDFNVLSRDAIKKELSRCTFKSSQELSKEVESIALESQEDDKKLKDFLSHFVPTDGEQSEVLENPVFPPGDKRKVIAVNVPVLCGEEWLTDHLKGTNNLNDVDLLKTLLNQDILSSLLSTRDLTSNITKWIAHLCLYHHSTEVSEGALKAFEQLAIPGNLWFPQWSTFVTALRKYGAQLSSEADPDVDDESSELSQGDGFGVPLPLNAGVPEFHISQCLKLFALCLKKNHERTLGDYTNVGKAFATIGKIRNDPTLMESSRVCADAFRALNAIFDEADERDYEATEIIKAVCDSFKTEIENSPAWLLRLLRFRFGRCLLARTVRRDLAFELLETTVINYELTRKDREAARRHAAAVDVLNDGDYEEDDEGNDDNNYNNNKEETVVIVPEDEGAMAKTEIVAVKKSFTQDRLLFKISDLLEDVLETKDYKLALTVISALAAWLEELEISADKAFPSMNRFINVLGRLSCKILSSAEHQKLSLLTAFLLQEFQLVKSGGMSGGDEMFFSPRVARAAPLSSSDSAQSSMSTKRKILDTD